MWESCFIITFDGIDTRIDGSTDNFLLRTKVIKDANKRFNSFQQFASLPFIALPVEPTPIAPTTHYPKNKFVLLRQKFFFSKKTIYSLFTFLSIKRVLLASSWNRIWSLAYEYGINLHFCIFTIMMEIEHLISPQLQVCKWSWFSHLRCVLICF